MNYDLGEMLSYKVKLMFFRLLGFAILGLLALFFYGIIKPENPKTRDDEIIKAAESSCIWEKKLEKAQAKIDKCLEDELAKNKKHDSDTLESCKKIGYGYAEIEYNNDGTMYNSTLRDIEDFKTESELLLSNNSKYISSCKKNLKIKDTNVNVQNIVKLETGDSNNEQLAK